MLNLRFDLDLGEVLLTMKATSEALVRFEMSDHVTAWIESHGGHLYLTRDEDDESFRSDRNRLTASYVRPHRDLSYMTIPYGPLTIHIQRTQDVYMYETVHVWLKKRFFFFKSLSARVMIYKRFSTTN
jgi:hypothetical protein